MEPRKIKEPALGGALNYRTQDNQGTCSREGNKLLNQEYPKL